MGFFSRLFQPRSDGTPVTLTALTGDYCNACGEVLLDGAEGKRVMDAAHGESTA